MIGGYDMKYSIIITVYNGEKYLYKCISSVINQTYKNYELIIVDDGSTDNTKQIANQFKYDNIKYFYKENGGVSDARNFGISKVTGEYFMFVDADDYISINALEIVNKNIILNTDILSFNIVLKDNNDNDIKYIKKPIFNNFDGEKAIINYIENCDYFDTPVAYVYRTKYFKDNQFLYAKGRVHEDFGLTPLVIIKAKHINSIPDFLYFYVQSKNSITRNQNMEKLANKARDMIYHFDYLYMTVNNDPNINKYTKLVFNSFIANAVISRAVLLKGKKRKQYIKEIKRRKMARLLLSNSINRLIKKTLIKISPNIYFIISRKKRGI